VHRDAVLASRLVLPVDGPPGNVGGLRSGR